MEKNLAVLPVECPKYLLARISSLAALNKCSPKTVILAGIMDIVEKGSISSDRIRDEFSYKLMLAKLLQSQTEIENTTNSDEQIPSNIIEQTEIEEQTKFEEQPQNTDETVVLHTIDKYNLDKDTFHKLYGCFGVRAVKKKGQYVYNKQSSNLVRLKVRSYIVTQKPLWGDLRSWLKHKIKPLQQYHTKQSIQIGIIQALQSQGYNGQEIYGLLSDMYGGIFKGGSVKDTELRNNAAQFRQSDY